MIKISSMTCLRASFVFSVIFVSLNFLVDVAYSAEPKKTAKIAPSKFACDKSQSRVEFEAIGKPSLLRIVGKGVGVRCTGLSAREGSNADFEFDLNGLDTGISLRDRHMKEKYLKTKEFPKATLKLSPLPHALEKQSSGTFKAMLKLLETEKEVSGKFTSTPNENGSDIHAEFELKITDFGIDIPSFAGVTVAETVKVKVDTVLQKQ
jgi:polyisoprenoid-binding protein YceI